MKCNTEMVLYIHLMMFIVVNSLLLPPPQSFKNVIVFNSHFPKLIILFLFIDSLPSLVRFFKNVCQAYWFACMKTYENLFARGYCDMFFLNLFLDFVLQTYLTNGLGVLVLGELSLISYEASFIRASHIVFSCCLCSADIFAETLPSNFSHMMGFPFEPRIH